MFKNPNLVGIVFGASCLLGSAVWAQNPTFTLMVTKVNSTEPIGGPSRRIAVAPGDTMTVKLFLRDWSPAGDDLRAYQGTMDIASFTSGFKGSIKPIDYDAKQATDEQNNEQCFVDRTHPDFVFGKLEVIAVTDTISPAYRWAGVLLDGTQSIVCEQTGKMFYAGTVHLQASADAEGPFMIRLIQIGGNSGLHKPKNIPIIPIDYEDLEIIVTESARVLRVVGSNPADGTVDARDAAGNIGGWKQIELAMSGDASGVSAADFELSDGSDSPPQITRVDATGSTVRVTLNRGIRPGAWTRVLHKPSRIVVNLGCLPGDVNQDGHVDAADLLLAIGGAEEGQSGTGPVVDINRDNRFDVGDALGMIELLNRPNACRRSLDNQTGP